MIDIHSHIIPNIDDGSKSLEMSLEMLKRAEESGTKKIITSLRDIGQKTITV